MIISSCFLVIQGIFFTAQVVSQQSQTEERLLNAIEDARRELADERERINREENTMKKELEEATAKLSMLSDELIDRTLLLAGKAKKLQELRDARAKLRQANIQLQRSRDEIIHTLTDAFAKISDLLETLPPSENRALQNKLLAGIKTELEKVGSQSLPDLHPFIALFKSLFDEINTANIYRGTIRNAEGLEETADILRVGMAVFGYRGRSSLQVGLKMLAPGGEKGYRWSEDLPSWAISGISDAIDGGYSEYGVYPLPVDVTQQLSMERSYGVKGAWSFIVAGGFVMVPLGVVALLAAFLITERILFLKKEAKLSEKTAENILELCKSSKFSEAQQFAEQASGPVSKVMSACLAKRELGVASMKDSVQETTLHELPQLERFLPLIGVLAGTAPLLGLLGTVVGMMNTFDMITVYGSSEPGIMAGGIYEALITTAAGLVIAIPIILFHSYLSSRVDRLLVDMERFSAALIGCLASRLTSGDVQVANK